MVEISKEEFRQAYRKEKDPRVVRRMAAVNMAYYNRESTQHVADSLMQCPNWVLKWVGRFEEGGMDALRDLPRAGRPPRVRPGTVEKIMDGARREKTTPKQVRQEILEKTSVEFHITYVRKLMVRRGLSGKRATKVHVNHADAGTVNSWRYRLKKRIQRLKRLRYVVAVGDEAFFVQDGPSGRKYWSPKGVPVKIPYAGNRRRLTVLGAVTDRGRQLFRTTTKGFNNKTFIPFVRALLRRFKRVALIMDRASTHRSKMMKKKFGKNKNLQIIYLPRASPYLNASEHCWSRGKHDVMNSEYYPTFEDMRNAVSKYYRTTKFNLDLLAYFNRKTSEYA